MSDNSLGLSQLLLLNPRAYALVGAPIALIVVCLYGLPAHAAIAGGVMTVATGLAVNTIGHIWGKRPYDTGDESRNSFLLGLTAFGDGWHNNHHAFPYSARHGFHWWQLDLTWSVIWLLERLGIAWDVKRPKFASAGESDAATAVTRSRV